MEVGSGWRLGVGRWEFARRQRSADAMSGYFAERHPESIGYTGQRAFAIATSATIYVKDDGTLIAPGMAGASALR